ncbi:MAG TPA: hypothetical protein VF392_00785 [Terracidiphilus sp.]
MRSVTKAEVEKNLGAVLDAAAKEPVRIREANQEFVLVSAAQFAEAQELLRKARVRKLASVMDMASKEAKAKGLTEAMLPELLNEK